VRHPKGFPWKRQFTPQQNVAILRERLVEHVSLLDLCDKHKLHSALFYQWQKAFFDNVAASLSTAVAEVKPWVPARRSLSNGSLTIPVIWFSTITASDDCPRQT
jgi:hypothetical protein